MKIITGAEFDQYMKDNSTGDIPAQKNEADSAVREIIEAVRREGDKAVRRFAAKFDRSSPAVFEIPSSMIRDAAGELEKTDPSLTSALKLSVENIRRFSLLQREQFTDFEFENSPGVFTGQRVIPVEKAAVYVPGGRFPLISSAVMGLIPAFSADVGEVCLASPPLEDGLPDRRILGAAALTAGICKRLGAGFRVFAVGGAQAVAALALGTETIPRCDVIAGPGNKYVAAAKRMLSGEVGIDFVAGPTDVLVITGEDSSPELAAADMLAQAEHDPDARARALVPSGVAAKRLMEALERRLKCLAEKNSGSPAQISLETGGLIIIYKNKDEASRIANIIAPEHLELQVSNPCAWIRSLKHYGSLFTGALSAEVLGDYSAGINHTLPTSGSARFSGGLSVRHFLKTVTTLRCTAGNGYTAALEAAEIIARAEGLLGHAESAACRRTETDML